MLVGFKYSISLPLLKSELYIREIKLNARNVHLTVIEQLNGE